MRRSAKPLDSTSPPAERKAPAKKRPNKKPGPSTPVDVRQAVRDRDQRCQAAGRVPGVYCLGREQVHHLWRRSQGGPDEEWNLKLLCLAHHSWVHANVAAAKRLDLIRVPGDTDGSLTRARSGMVDPCP